MHLRKGAIVERFIEGTGFLAEILSIDTIQQEVSIRYLDDDNIEHNVPLDDVRETQEVAPSPRRSNKDTLPKPLIGLLDDDSDLRLAHRPTVIIHHDDETGIFNITYKKFFCNVLMKDKAVILHGSEKSLAVGGGLRALRYLRK